MAYTQLTSIDEMNTFVDQAGTHVLFKHSTTCPISAKAFQEFQSFLADTDASAAVVHVIEDRPVSLEVAEKLGIKHESPQVFVLKDGAVSFHTSHWKITKQALQEAVGE